MKYSLAKIAKICSGKLTGQDGIFTAVTTDSRSCSTPRESIFVAIHGANHNGHDYITELYALGVRGFIIEQKTDTGRFPEAGFVLCRSSVDALQALAAHHRAGFTGTVAAITGSNGKTVVKEWIAQLAPRGMKLFRSPRSYNSQIGVALALLMIEGDEQVAVIEAGISKPSEMERLERMIKPQVGIITNIGDAHQENFRSTDHKLKEKLKLFNGCQTVIYGHELAGDLKNRFADKRLFDADPAQYDLSGLPLRNDASMQNMSLALTFYRALGYAPSSFAAKLSDIEGVAMRLELKDGIGGSKIINDTYNSDINSLSLALDYLQTVAAGGRKTLILSDISQSGLSQKELYLRVAEMVRKSGTDHFIGIGKGLSRNASAFGCKSDFFLSTDEFLSLSDRSTLSNSTILIKGGRAFGFEKISHALELQTHTTVLEVNLDNMIHNLNYFRSLLGEETKVMAMVKALSYGNGSFEVAGMLQHQKVSYLAVAFADEGVTLRRAGIKMPIVVLNADNDSFDMMVSNSLEPEIYSFSSLESFTRILRREGVSNYPIHIKLDTGMHRLGFVPEDIDPLTDILRNSDEVRVSTIFSHLAGSDERQHDDFTRAQIATFRAMSDKMVNTLPYSITRHISNSAAIERFPEARFDMVRLGIGLYGISTEHQQDMLPVSTLKSRIVQIKEIPQGDTIGYGRHGKAGCPTRTATVPIGYADGLDRHLSRGQWSMLVNGRLAPIIGNICMDTCMLDITGIEVSEGDSVVIFGPEEVSVSKMAEKLGTIPYEVMTSISARVKRIYTKE